VSEKGVPRRVVEAVTHELRDERIRQHVSMDSLAAKSGLSQPMISYVERGMRNPMLDTLLRIAGALEVDLASLIKRAVKSKRRT
jgi:transcriptional regulator with XRE-family HTH domain